MLSKQTDEVLLARKIKNIKYLLNNFKSFVLSKL